MLIHLRAHHPSGPIALRIKIYPLNAFTQCIGEFDRVTEASNPACSEGRNLRVEGTKRSGVGSDDQKPRSRQDRGGRKLQAHVLSQSPAANIYRGAPRIMKLDPLLKEVCGGWMIVNLVNHHIGQGRVRREE